MKKELKPKKENLEKIRIEYPINFKRWLAIEVESGRISLKKAMESFNIPGHSTIYGWIERYGLRKELTLSQMTPEEKQQLESVKKRIKDLEKALEHAKMKNIALETLIDVAEKELKISIRKKSGPKQ